MFDAIEIKKTKEISVTGKRDFFYEIEHKILNQERVVSVFHIDSLHPRASTVLSNYQTLFTLDLDFSALFNSFQIGA